MAIVMTSTSQMTSGQYDQVIARLAPELAAAEGFIAHFARPGTDGGWTVIEVWESEQQQAAWYDAKVRPHLPPGSPEPGIRPLHNLLLAS